MTKGLIQALGGQTSTVIRQPASSPQDASNSHSTRNIAQKALAQKTSNGCLKTLKKTFKYNRSYLCLRNIN